MIETLRAYWSVFGDEQPVWTAPVWTAVLVSFRDTVRKVPLCSGEPGEEVVPGLQPSTVVQSLTGLKTNYQNPLKAFPLKALVLVLTVHNRLIYKDDESRGKVATHILKHTHNLTTRQEANGK